jgi:hypothetical protein
VLDILATGGPFCATATAISERVSDSHNHTDRGGTRFEEGTWAAWLYDLLKPHVTRVVVCDPRRNALFQEGNQNDRVDARKLAELLQNNQLRPVYHGDHGLRTLKELVRSYLTITNDLSRVMSRVKAIYRRLENPSR